MISAKVVCHSTYEGAVPEDELITLEVEFHRFILSEVNTHRCLAAETELWFDLPSGSRGSDKRIHKLTIKDFHDRWHYGAAEHVCGSTLKLDMENIENTHIYTAAELAKLCNICVTNIRTSCRNGELIVQNPDKKRTEDWKILGFDFKKYRENRGKRRFPINKRLGKMKLRMANKDGKIEHTNVTDVWYSGFKPVFKVVLDNGFEIRVTDNHPLLSEVGWKELKDLKVGDALAISGQSVEQKKEQNRFKKIDGRWVNKFNKEVLPSLSEKQNGKCFSCEQKNLKLEVHHIVPVHIDKSKAFDLENVVAVCEECHNNYHREQGWQEGNISMVKYCRIVNIVEDGEDDVYDLSVTAEEHNFVANGFIVHNCLSRNYQSSRAVPVEKLLEQVKNNPAMPIHWGKNQRGMVAEEENNSYLDVAGVCGTNGNPLISREEAWHGAAMSAAEVAEAMHKAGYHKQIVNRLLEPFMWTRGVITATRGGWNSVFALRCHPDAQPEFQALAYKIKEAIENSKPQMLKPGGWHLPYIESFWGRPKSGYGDRQYFPIFLQTKEEKSTRTWNAEYSLPDVIKISTSCCAQVSYRQLDESLEKAIKIYDMLNLPEGGKFKTAPAHCYDKDTEVLTDKGFIKWEDLSGESLALIDPTDSHFKGFSNKYEKIHYNFSGKMYHFTGKEIDLKITDGHNLYASRIKKQQDRKKEKYELFRANEHNSSKAKYKTAGESSMKMLRSAKQSEHFIGTEWSAYLKLVGFFLGDGSLAGDKSIRFHLKKKRKIEYLKAIAKDANLQLYNTGDHYRVEGSTLKGYFSKFYNAGSKVLPGDVWQTLNSSEIACIFDGLKNSDGSIKRNTWVYSTTSEQLKDTLEIIGALHGYSITVSKTIREDDKHKNIFRLNISSKNYILVNDSRNSTSVEIIDVEDEPVYCANTGNNVLVVRRNGKIILSGNCSPCEHQACVLGDKDKGFFGEGGFGLNGNFGTLGQVKWGQYRKILEKGLEVDFI